jgi:hypothetical protein
MDRYKLHRSDAPNTSKDAAYAVDVTGRAKLVLDAVKASGELGATVKEIWRDNIDIPYSSISARPAALEEAGLIYYRDEEKRDGARVMRAMVGKGDLQLSLI